MKRQQKEMIALAALLLTAAVVWLYVSRRPTATTRAGSASMDFEMMAVENPQLHWWKVAEARKTEYQSHGRDPFSAVAPPPPVDPKRAAEDQRKANSGSQPATMVPPPPILPVKFFGYGTVPNGTPRRAFFTDQDEVYIAAEGEMLLGRFRVLHIGNDTVEFEEVSTGLRNTAAIVEQGPSS